MSSISEALSLAIQHHQAGRLRSAEQIYRQILAIEPDQADAIHLLGVLAAQAGRHDVAVEYIRRAIALRGGAASFHNSLGEAYRGLRRISEAAASYRRALELNPQYFEAWNNLGVALKDLGQLDEAAACLRSALELRPKIAVVHNNLGIALKESGNLDEAVACYRRALELDPNLAEVHSNLGAALIGVGKQDEAAECYRRALALKPDFADAAHKLGNLLREQGAFDEAIASYRRALQSQPDDAALHNNLGVVLKEQGRLQEAIACYRRALELKPDFAEVQSNLGSALKDQGNLDEAAAACRQALALKPDFAPAHVNLGNALKDMGRLDEAIACYRRALELQEDNAEAHVNLGGALEELGDLQGAEASYRAALRHNPRYAFAHYMLARLLRGQLPEEDLAMQRRLLEDARLTDAERLLLHFGLAQALDGRREYAAAAQHLDRGNALQLADWRRRGQEYDPQEFGLFVERIIAACDADFFRRTRDWGSPSEVPVFVVGLPRSGTSLIEQILASHSRIFGAGELKLAGTMMSALCGPRAESIENLRRLDRDKVQNLASQHLDALQSLDPKALRIVDKMPDNYLFLGLLAVLFPRAKFIHCRRDLRDVAVSCWMTHFREVHWTNDFGHIASRFFEYRRIMAHWREVLPARLLAVDYEDTVADVEGVARRLIAWCGLEWEPGCLEFHRTQRPVATLSAAQVRRPVYAASAGRWRHYAEPLAALLSLLPGPSGVLPPQPHP